MNTVHIDLPDPVAVFDRYRRAKTLGQAKGQTLEQWLTKAAESKGFRVVRFIEHDFGHRWSVEVEDTRPTGCLPTPHDLHQIAN